MPGTAPPAHPRQNHLMNKLAQQDKAAHDWYRFVLSFPPHLVRNYIDKLGVQPGQRVLDPFCGTGTTLVECKKLGIASIGVEANPMAYFASTVKVDWRPDPDGLLAHACLVAEHARQELQASGIQDDLLYSMRPPVTDAHRVLRGLSPEQTKLILTDSISPLPLHKILVLRDHLRRYADPVYEHHEMLALSKALIGPVGNLHFGPEVGVGPAKPDAAVIDSWLNCIQAMASDLRELRNTADVSAVVLHADARQIGSVIEPGSIDAVFTSPPYPNEKDYTRTTRLESVVLGFIESKADLRVLKAGLVRSNTRNVYKGDSDDEWVVAHPEIQRIAEAIESRRLELGKTSGFERLYGKVTKLYFGGMARHLADLRTVLRPGARLGYVVGDQASYLRIMIRTGELLADIAQALGYEVVSIDLFRTRLATATRDQLREEVVVLRWPGAQLGKGE